MEAPYNEKNNMDEYGLTRTAKDAGFDSIEAYVKANLHYLDHGKQRLFNMILYSTNKKQTDRYYGKN